MSDLKDNPDFMTALKSAYAMGYYDAEKAERQRCIDAVDTVETSKGMTESEFKHAIKQAIREAQK